VKKKFASMELVRADQQRLRNDRAQQQKDNEKLAGQWDAFLKHATTGHFGVSAIPRNAPLGFFVVLIHSAVTSGSVDGNEKQRRAWLTARLTMCTVIHHLHTIKDLYKVFYGEDDNSGKVGVTTHKGKVETTKQLIHNLAQCSKFLLNCAAPSEIWHGAKFHIGDYVLAEQRVLKEWQEGLVYGVHESEKQYTVCFGSGPLAGQKVFAHRMMQANDADNSGGEFQASDQTPFQAAATAWCGMHHDNRGADSARAAIRPTARTFRIFVNDQYLL